MYEGPSAMLDVLLALWARGSLYEDLSDRHGSSRVCNDGVPEIGIYLVNECSSSKQCVQGVCCVKFTYMALSLCGAYGSVCDWFRQPCPCFMHIGAKAVSTDQQRSS